MIAFTQLRCFIAVATELHFGRAAQMLHMTQPPLSRQIQLLEEQLGVSLFDRTSRSVSLTASGAAFLGEARKLMEQSERAIQVARRAGNTLSGSVTIGFMGSAAYGFIPKLAERARAEIPNIEVIFREMTTRDQLEALPFGRIDLGIIRPHAKYEGLESVCIERGDLSLAVVRSHALASRRQLVTLKQLHDVPFIMYSKVGWYFHDLLTAMFEQAHVQPRYVQSMDQTHAILSLVSAGMGVAIVPEDARNACFENVVFKPLQTQAQYELHAVWRDEEHTPAVAAVRDIVMRHWAASQAQH